MIETEPDILEKHDGKNYKDDERNDFLKYLQLKQAERATISFKANPVRRHLKHIFKQRKTQLIRITAKIPAFFSQPISPNFRCPYHARVMKTLETIKKRMVVSPLPIG